MAEITGRRADSPGTRTGSAPPRPSTMSANQPPPREALRRALGWYLLWSGAALAAVVVGVVVFSGVVAKAEALRDAEHTARAIADAIVRPLATEDFHLGDPESVAAMGQAMEYRSRDGSITHIKLWADAGDGRGRIIWASTPELVDKTFTMEQEEYALFRTGGLLATVSDLEKEENVLERAAGQLVEVYAATWDAAGDPLLFEAYISTAGLSSQTKALMRDILPVPLAAVVILSIASLPLAISLARRVDRGQQQMRSLLVNAVEASDLERRRIARDLHDGVIQDLAGVCYALSAESRHLPEGSAVRAHIVEASAILRRDLSSLRTLMTDIYPPQLDEKGLGRAVRDLGQQVGRNSATIRFEVDETLAVPPITSRLAYRAIRELLGNSAKHAQASTIVVHLHQEADALRFSVQDDGIGFELGQPGPEGHLGLRLVEEMIAESGGSLVFDSNAGMGTTASGWLPL